MFEIIEGSGKPIKAWVHGVPVEESAKQQLRNLSVLPFILRNVTLAGIDADLGEATGLEASAVRSELTLLELLRRVSRSGGKLAKSAK